MEASNSHLDSDNPVPVSLSLEEVQDHLSKKLGNNIFYNCYSTHGWCYWLGRMYSTYVNTSRSEKIIQFLAIFTFSLFFGLLIMQVNMAWQSYQMLQQLSAGPDLPDTVYSLYFDYLETGLDPNQVDLRANTTIFVH